LLFFGRFKIKHGTNVTDAYINIENNLIVWQSFDQFCFVLWEFGQIPGRTFSQPSVISLGLDLCYATQLMATNSSGVLLQKATQANFKIDWVHQYYSELSHIISQNNLKCFFSRTKAVSLVYPTKCHPFTRSSLRLKR
jgi:hypothetical protein